MSLHRPPSPLDAEDPAHREERSGTERDMNALPLGCDTCDAVCCRQIVVLQREDRIPAHLSARTADGRHVMARDEEGWCVAVSASTMRCSIYSTRPQVCRDFAMDGPCCRALRSDHAERLARGIPLAMH